MLAYFGDSKIRAKYLRRVRAHGKADQIIQGYGYWKDGKGCAVGCTLHGSKHANYETELGIPVELAYLEDHFFERLPVKTAREWPARFLAAIKTGADLSRVYDFWTVWNLIDPLDGVITLVTDQFPEIQKIIRETAVDCMAGNRVNAAWAARAADAARAAWAARAADAARAARAADAAWAARAADAVDAADAAWAARAADAAWAARAARAADAAWAADAARAAWAARAAYYKKASDKLIELLESAT